MHESIGISFYKSNIGGANIAKWRTIDPYIGLSGSDS